MKWKGSRTRLGNDREDRRLIFVFRRTRRALVLLETDYRATEREAVSFAEPFFQVMTNYGMSSTGQRYLPASFLSHILQGGSLAGAILELLLWVLCFDKRQSLQQKSVNETDTKTEFRKDRFLQHGSGQEKESRRKGNRQTTMPGTRSVDPNGFL